MSQILVEQLTKLLSSDNIKTETKQTEYYRHGFRSGSGDAVAVVFPQTLMQLWRVLQACVDADAIIIMQAAKTGLTEGSTPNGTYDRPVIVINTLAMNKIELLNDGKQILSFPGASLFQLEEILQPIQRTPHSVIGSTCIGASIIGGVANNSGGALVKRGPSYTQASLFAQVNQDGKLELINHLGIDLGDTPEEIINHLEAGDYNKNPTNDGRATSSDDYIDIVRDVDADTPARFNADKRRLFEASGCAGKIAVFAVILDSFAIPQKEQTYYIGTNDTQVFARLRRKLLQGENLPDVGEYMHRDIFDISDKYGKDTFLAIKHLGTKRMPKLFATKGRIDAIVSKFPFLPNHLSDCFIQAFTKILPKHLPKRLLDYRTKYEHHLILKMTDNGIAEADNMLKAFFDEPTNEGGYFVCDATEAQSAYLHRFAAAGAAIRYETVHHKNVEGLIALDIALRRNDMNWLEDLPATIADKLELKLYYGHFMCYVFHQDYIIKKGEDVQAVKKAMLAYLDSRGAKYPAEHNVGHIYEAEDDLRKFYQSLDPTNRFNPGIGKTDKHARNCSCG
ncbi:MAG: D-lactate dehydrogenase [Alphaproteobacteria bacterium]